MPNRSLVAHWMLRILALAALPLATALAGCSGDGGNVLDGRDGGTDAGECMLLGDECDTGAEC
ncbi:MAG: hypothetical protein ACOC9O_02130, partial [Myxococcota bacterium]